MMRNPKPNRKYFPAFCFCLLLFAAIRLLCFASFVVTFLWLAYELETKLFNFTAFSSILLNLFKRDLK